MVLGLVVTSSGPNKVSMVMVNPPMVGVVLNQEVHQLFNYDYR